MQNQIQGILHLDGILAHALVGCHHVGSGGGDGDVGNGNEHGGSQNHHDTQIGKQRQAHLIVVLGHEGCCQDHADGGGEHRGINGLTPSQDGPILEILAHNGLHQARTDIEDCIAQDIDQVNQDENQDAQLAQACAEAKLEHGKDADGHNRPADDGQGTGSAPFAFKPVTPQTDQRVCDCVKYTGAGNDIPGEYG